MPNQYTKKTISQLRPPQAMLVRPSATKVMEAAISPVRSEIEGECARLTEAVQELSDHVSAMENRLASVIIPPSATGNQQPTDPQPVPSSIVGRNINESTNMVLANISRIRTLMDLLAI